MIRVTVELYNARKNGERSILGVMDICNEGTHTDPARGNYSGRIYKKGTDPRKNVPFRDGAVKDFPRHSYVIWRLVFRMLREMFPEEKSS